jgi:hypothetical protein
MKVSIGKWLPVLAAAFVAAAFVIVSDADAARGGGGGARGGGGGGGARASGGGRQAQVNNSRADARTTNVRSGSVNNINVERNVNIEGGCCGGWDNDYHPVARAAVVGAAVATTAAVVGSMVATVPAGCVPVNYGGMVYQQCGGTWYQPQGTQYVVVNAPY